MAILNYQRVSTFLVLLFHIICSFLRGYLLPKRDEGSGLSLANCRGARIRIQKVVTTLQMSWGDLRYITEGMISGNWVLF